jgi:hypothetical protein
MWLAQGMQWLGAPTGKRGRSPTPLPVSEICMQTRFEFDPDQRAPALAAELLDRFKA